MPHRAVVRPLGTTQSDPGVVEKKLQSVGFPDSLPNDDLFERIHDAPFKRAKDSQLPSGGAYMGHVDSRSIDMFLQAVKRAPGWSVGVMPELFQAYYLEFCLDASVRGVITGIVDKELKERGLKGYYAISARATCIESALRARFESINSHRILADRWESLRWNIADDFEKFYLEFQEVRDSYSRQRQQELQGADVVERLFGALTKELADRLIKQYGGSPSEKQILEFCRRENMILTRNRALKNGSARSGTKPNVNSVRIEDEVDIEELCDGLFAMPVEQTTTSTQTSNCLFVSNLAFTASERDLLGAFRSVLKVSGAIPRGIRLFKDGRNGRSRGIGLIEFDTPDAASKALGVVDGQQVLGRKVRARRDRGPSTSSSTPTVNAPSGPSKVVASEPSPGTKRRRIDDSPEAEVIAEGSGQSVDVNCVQHEDHSSGVQNLEDVATSETRLSDSVPVVNGNSTLCAVVETLHFDDIDHEKVDVEVELNGLVQDSGSDKRLTMVTSLVSVKTAKNVCNSVAWLLDSGCALHLIDKETHPWLCDARSVRLPKPVRLIFANGTSQFVEEAKLVAFVCGDRRYYTHVLVVEGLTVSGILSVHQLVTDFGTVAWHLGDDNAKFYADIVSPTCGGF
ncbi:hypothetical protein Pmar_PMAR019959 [Perkinsus marinus ATCC 50983]|uniref:RRM domain-containing protein n=1 Tax=Perkinsus marinus (strain ATCC 50983 / TXsc) TaxID=423536 RepID=C5LJ66_PERM5|nr:hypothetical protein Pmar_PMAR019959 [Perkinsus marinus ATCC 50983]EER03182.1 hypothetical protein Pmar_PMAR019959 [Perkinsus marinus ATCC 50983]|eukprot:XP_002771366.1 hypothetical protein Pmar_PMAR019959 [Perkinsus marinus ATCC 50983]